MEKIEQNYFNLDRNSEIWIYGADVIGEHYGLELLKQGYQVKGFIDINAGNIVELCGRKVLSPDAVAEVVPKDAIVIISLRNGLQHDKVVAQLAKTGLHKFIYLPMQIRQSLFARRKYRENYARLRDCDFSHIKQIPVFYNKSKALGCIVIAHNFGKVAFWCEINMLNSGKTVEVKNEVIKRWEINEEVINQYIDRKIEEMYPYINLFRYLKGEEVDISSYMEMQGRKTPEQIQELLEDRKMLYQVFEQAYKYEMNFFTDSPSVCVWNERGYFNVQDGIHRAQYLISKGYKEVPIVVTRADFEKYISYGENQ